MPGLPNKSFHLVCKALFFLRRVNYKNYYVNFTGNINFYHCVELHNLIRSCIRKNSYQIKLFVYVHNGKNNYLTQYFILCDYIIKSYLYASKKYVNTHNFKNNTVTRHCMNISFVYNVTY